VSDSGPIEVVTLVRLRSSRSFAVLWLGQGVSSLGTQVSIVAVPLIAVIHLHASTFAVGAITAAGFLPYLLLGLHAGVYADRADPRKLMMWCDLLRAAVLVAMVGLSASGKLSILALVVAAVAIGCCTVLFEVSYQAYLPRLVASSALVEANARLETTRAGTQVAGPTLGGWLVQALGAAIALAADGVSYAISFACITALPSFAREGAERAPVLADVRAGLRFVASERALRAILQSYSLSVFFVGAYQGIMIVYMSRTLGLSAGVIGVAMAIGNCGFLLGAALSRRISAAIGVGTTVILSLGLLAVGFLIVGAASRSAPLPFVIAGQIIACAGTPIYNINVVSLRQALTPQALLGRVASVSRVLGRGMVPVGALAGAALASAAGPRTGVLMAGVGGLLALLPFVTSDLVRLKTLGEAKQTT
jgi:predicted MFS family arabinose efflux permease